MTRSGLSYGGNQGWLDGRWLQQGGCGVVAACDLLEYLSGKEQDGKADIAAYKRRIRRIRSHFLMMGPLGVAGIFLAWGLNACFARAGLAYRARWGVAPSRLRSHIERMLSEDIPVIFSVGPDVPLLFRSHKLGLYVRDAAGNMKGAGYAVRHYMMITGTEGDYLKVSSWGRCYYVRWDEFNELATGKSRWMTSICLIKPIKRAAKPQKQDEDDSLYI